MPTEMGGGGSLALTYLLTGWRHDRRVAAGCDFVLDVGTGWGPANFGNFWGIGARGR